MQPYLAVQLDLMSTSDVHTIPYYLLGHMDVTDSITLSSEEDILQSQAQVSAENSAACLPNLFLLR